MHEPDASNLLESLDVLTQAALLQGLHRRELVESELLGTTRQTVSSLLNRMARESILGRAGNGISDIHDVERLRPAVRCPLADRQPPTRFPAWSLQISTRHRLPEERS